MSTFISQSWILKLIGHNSLKQFLLTYNQKNSFLSLSFRNTNRFLCLNWLCLCGFSFSSLWVFSNGLGLSMSSLSLGDVLINQLTVSSSGLDGLFPSSDLIIFVDSLSSDSNVSDQSLDSWSFLSLWSSWVLLALKSSSGDVLFNKSCGNGLIFFLSFDTVELSDVVGSLRTKSSWNSGVSDARDLLFTFLDDGYWKVFDIRTDDASSNGFSFSFSGSFGSVSADTWSEEEFESGVGENTLFHGKSVSVITTGDFEDVPLELITEWISFNLLSHPFFEENSALIIVVDVDALGGAVDWVGDWELSLERYLPSFWLVTKIYNFLEFID